MILVDECPADKIMGLLGKDLREFFFGCNIIFATRDEVERRRAPVTNFTFQLTVGEDSVKIKAKIYKTNKLKCARCLLYQKVVNDGICSECQSVMD